MKAKLEGLFLPAIVLLAWQMAAQFARIPDYLSSPTAIGAALLQLARDGELLNNLLISLFRAYAGFAIGAIAGAGIGLIAGLVKPIKIFFDPLVSLLYPIPKIAFLPIVFLLFGLGNGAQVSIIALSVFFPVFIAAEYAVLSVNRTLLWSARNMGAHPITVFRRVLVPATAPQLLAGLRVGLAHSFVLLFAAELIGAKNGLGFLIQDGEDNVQFDVMFAGIVLFAVIGFASDRILMAVRRRVLRGQTMGTQEVLQ
jgi:ABC-type nitrate/sulfonate/bicarbonate transport system permease component